MVRIQLATGYLDVKEGTAFPLSFQVGDIRDISQRKGSFSKTITLVGSKNNNDLLNHYYDVNIVAGSFNINAVTTCSVIQDGIPVMENASMQLTSVKKVQLTEQYEEHVEYEVLIKESKADFFTAINNKELTDIDFSDLNHTYDAFNVVNRFTNTEVDGFKYFLPGSGSVFNITQEFKPAIFAKTYFDRIFADSGFQYNWASLSATKFDKLVIPYNGGIDNFDYLDYVVRAEKTTPSTVLSPLSLTPTTGTYTFTGLTEIEDPQNIFDPVTGIYTTPFNISSANAQYYEIKILVNFSLDIINVGSNLAVGTPKFYLNFFNAPFNVNSASPFYSGPSTPGAGTTNITTDTLIVTIQATDPFLLPQLTSLTNNVQAIFDTTGGYYLLAYNLSLTINSAEISITPSSNIAAVGGTIDVNDYVPKKIKQNEFVKAIFNMFNLYAVVDKNQPNQLNLIHRDDYYDAGQEVDWTYKLAKDKEQSLSFLPELTSKKVILTYTPDTDGANATYTTATNQIYGQAEVVFDNEYVKDITTKPVLFGPTPLIKSAFGAYVPMLSGQAPKTNIRILYDSTADVGLTSCSPYHIYDYGTVGMQSVTSYPYVGHFDNPLNPTWDLNFSVCAFYYYQPSSLTDNNLYNRYWRRTMGQINSGKMLTAMFNLKDTDIQALRLNDKIRIDNSWWNINRVIDYNANANQLTQVELISIDSEVNFMPFINPFGTPGVGLPNISAIQQVANNSVVKSKSMNSNVLTGGQVIGEVVNRGNVVPGGLRVMVATEGYSVEDDGIVTDNLVVRGRMNGIPIEPSCYKYVANLDQTGTAAPIAYVKESSFGDIEWVRNSVGTYEGFIQNWEIGTILDTEITVVINNIYFDGVISAAYSASNNSIYITTTQIGVGFVDDYLGMNTLEIRYYKP